MSNFCKSPNTFRELAGNRALSLSTAKGLKGAHVIGRELYVGRKIRALTWAPPDPSALSKASTTVAVTCCSRYPEACTIMIPARSGCSCSIASLKGLLMNLLSSVAHEVGDQFVDDPPFQFPRRRFWQLPEYQIRVGIGCLRWPKCRLLFVVRYLP